jgi:two-component system, chemotaxis family, protein-glutamate methylesterase/glutaminase
VSQSENGRIHTVVLGASAGGIEALRGLIAQLPGDFPAAVCVVLHLARGPSVLPQILTRAGALPAVQAQDGMEAKGGRIYVAPPDCHLLVEDGTLRLDNGPRVNGHRPAIDTLFRSAAAAYGTSAAGVVLSGVLDDGTAGLMAIKRAGGMTLVQDPDDALYEMMPRSAIEIVLPDRVGTAPALGQYLAGIAATPPADPPRVGTRAQEHLVEVDRGSSDEPQPGRLTGFTCPECNGAIWLSDEHGIPKLACRTGHTYSLETFAASQTERVEVALWTALRTLEERAALYRRMAARHREHGNTRTAERLALQAESAVQHAFVIRELINDFDGEEEGAA